MKFTVAFAYTVEAESREDAVTEAFLSLRLDEPPTIEVRCEDEAAGKRAAA